MNKNMDRDIINLTLPSSVPTAILIPDGLKHIE